MRFALLVSLLILAAGFSAIAAAAFLAAPPAAPSLTPAAGAADPPARLALPASERTDFTPFTDRPLFSAVRRPPPPEAPGAPLIDPGAGLVLGLYEVTGVVMGAGGPVAMLRDESGRMIRIRVGDRIAARAGEAEVSAISLDALTFRRGDDTVVAPVRDEDPGGDGRAEDMTTE